MDMEVMAMKRYSTHPRSGTSQSDLASVIAWAPGLFFFFLFWKGVIPEQGIQSTEYKLLLQGINKSKVSTNILTCLKSYYFYWSVIIFKLYPIDYLWILGLLQITNVFYAHFLLPSLALSYSKELPTSSFKSGL